MIGAFPVHVAVGLAGLALGFVFGATVHRTNFCMMGAVADLALKGDVARLRAWAFAIAVATAGTQAIDIGGVVDVDSAFYLSPRLGWAGALLGGALFGFGMVIACGCGSRALVNFGAGDLRSLVALIFLGIFAYMTMRGVLAVPRRLLDDATTLDLTRIGFTSQSLAVLTGVPGGAGRVAFAGGVVGLISWFCLRDRAFRTNPSLVVASVVIGLVVTAGWLVTGVLGADEFEPTPLRSLSFVAPVGESIVYLMTFTGAQATFGVAVVAGVLTGSFASAALGGTLRLQAFEDTHDLVRYMAGGALMGTGGVLALGCTVGQGITGVATLSAGSWLALAGILGGSWLGVRYLEQGTLRGALRATMSSA